jgi:hypothetical protein
MAWRFSHSSVPGIPPGLGTEWWRECTLPITQGSDPAIRPQETSVDLIRAPCPLLQSSRAVRSTLIAQELSKTPLIPPGPRCYAAAASLACPYDASGEGSQRRPSRQCEGFTARGVSLPCSRWGLAPSQNHVPQLALENCNRPYTVFVKQSAHASGSDGSSALDLVCKNPPTPMVPLPDHVPVSVRPGNSMLLSGGTCQLDRPGPERREEILLPLWSR